MYRPRVGVADVEADAGKRERFTAAVGVGEVRCKRALGRVGMSTIKQSRQGGE